MTELSKWHESMIKKYGSMESWKAHQKAIGAMGGKTIPRKPRGFAARPELASTLGSKGGKISKRGKAKNHE